MYIQKVVIENIRSISHFEMEFPKPAGWHVLIGDNGSGKSSVVRAVAAVLIGPDQILAVLPVWEEWLSKTQREGSIKIELLRDKKLDKTSQTRPPEKPIINEYYIKRNGRVELNTNANAIKIKPINFNWSNNGGWFSVAFGPFRRLTGGDNKWNKVFYSAPKAGAHLSVFGEDIALTEALDWLKDLDRRRLKEKETSKIQGVNEPQVEYLSESESLFQYVKLFINNTGFLPHNAQFDFVDIDGEPVFKDGNGVQIKVTQMSDGYRSILSLTFELLRQLVLVYGIKSVFEKIKEGRMEIDLPGVALIDEIDVHLHPVWQTQIGIWFTKCFPKIQFIVTTHSPLICRACEKGSIWRLAKPGSDMKSGEITGVDRERLIYGNILDAYGTEMFGESVSQSSNATDMLKELADLNVKSFRGTITASEKKKMQELRKILPTAE